jgi:putative membrane protein
MIKQVKCTPGTLCFTYPLEKKKLIKKTFLRSGGIILIFLIFSFIWLSNKFKIIQLLDVFSPVVDILLYVNILLLLLIGISFIEELLYFRNYFYDLKEGGLLVSKGVINKHEVLVPVDKIQDIYIDQDLLDRIFGLYDLHVATAGFGSSDIHIDGISYMSAEAIKELLLGKAGKAKEKKEKKE